MHLRTRPSITNDRLSTVRRSDDALTMNPNSEFGGRLKNLAPQRLCRRAFNHTSLGRWKVWHGGCITEFNDGNARNELIGKSNTNMNAKNQIEINPSPLDFVPDEIPFDVPYGLP